MAYQSNDNDNDNDFDNIQEDLDYDEIKQQQEDKSVQDYYDKLEYDDLRLMEEYEKQRLKKNYEKYNKKQQIIKNIKKLQKINEKMEKNIPLKESEKPKRLRKEKKEKKKIKIKTFEEYFEECIKNKKIPPDTPSYFRKALERAINEHDQGIIKEKSSLENFANKYDIEGEHGFTPVEFFKNNAKKLEDFLRNNRNIKFRLVLVCLMEKQIIDRKIGITALIEDKGYFHSETHINLESTDVKRLLALIIKNILNKLEEYQKNGSGWYFKEIVSLKIHTVEYNPMNGSSYIPLPDWISKKRAIINIQNRDEKCFLWCILRYIYPSDENDTRLTDLKKYEYILNTKGINFPMKLKEISKFEKLNPSLPGINVFSVRDNNKFYPLRMAEKDCQNTIDLFLYEEDGKSHYSFIKNFNRLFRSQITSSKNGEVFICKKCFTHYTKNELLEKHILYCSSNETVSVKMPPRNIKLCFNNYNKQFPIPFVIYADFECFTKPMSNCSPNPEDSYTYNYQKHEPSGFCFYIKGIVPNKFKPIIYTKKNSDDNLPLIFVNKLEKVTNKIYEDFYMRSEHINITQKQYREYSKSTVCHICNKEVIPEDKVCDHCHFTGEYRGPAHRNCNLQCRKPMIIPVIFHNLQGYDAHLFIKQLANIKGDFTCIPSTEEKYIYFLKR